MRSIRFRECRSSRFTGVSWCMYRIYVCYAMVNETNYVQMRTVFLDSLPIRSVRETYERECEWTVFITTGVRERKKKGKEGDRERERERRTTE